ncbi:hypothetical protein LTR66_013499 [Elasticomyces elasticus]|nr:hypothetical protein LTR66_013499 [Elasticomyces elasticus]
MHDKLTNTPSTAPITPNPSNLQPIPPPTTTKQQPPTTIPNPSNPHTPPPDSNPTPPRSHTQTAADERAKHALRIELKIHDLIGLLRMQVKEHLEKDDVEALETVRDGLVEVVRANGGGGVGAGRT